MGFLHIRSVTLKFHRQKTVKYHRVSTGCAGQTFLTLTTGLDNFVGTSNNDTVNGYATVESTNGTFSASTFNTADQINGGAGTDTLNLTIDGALKANTVTAISAASISNVETLNLRNVAGTTGGTEAVSADASLIPGLTTFNSDRSTNTVTVTNLASGASAGMIGDGNVTNGAFNAGYVATAASSTLNISGGTKAGAVTLSGTGLTSATVTSTGAANTIGALTLAATQTSLTVDAAVKLTTGAVSNTGAAALTSVTVKGAGAVNLSTTALPTTVTKVDASANSGGLTVKLSDKTTISVTGSTGNDVITTNAVLTTGSVNAGDGIDTLDLGTNVAHANTSALAAKYTNFETLRVNGTFDASLIAGITAIELSGAVNTISKLSATQAAAVTARADIGNTTLALAVDTGTSDVLSLTMGTGTTTAAATNAGALTINGIETLNVKTNAGPTSTTGANKTTTIGSFVADKLTAINLSGNAVTLSNAATTKAVTIDASALTGDGATDPVGLTVSGNVVTGSTVIALGGGLLGVDMDACLVDGQLEPWAADVVERLATYAEISPSGGGIKLLMRLKSEIKENVSVKWGDPVSMPDGSSKHRELALYSDGRYFTITESVWSDAPIRMVSPEDLEWLLERIEVIKAAKKAPSSWLTGSSYEDSSAATGTK